MKSLSLILFICFLIYSEPYSIQWGAFDSAGAVILVDSLKEVELPVYTQKATVKGVKYTRVRTGPFENIQEAQRAAALINISTPYLVKENGAYPPIFSDDLVPKSFAGMIPVIIRDSISMPKDSCDRVFCFDYPRFRKVEINEMMEQYYAGFYDPQNGRVISLFEGINSITPLAENYYLMIRQYTGWGPGVFHPYYQTNYLFKSGQKHLQPVAENLGELRATDSGFLGIESRGNFSFQLLNSPLNERPSDTIFFSLIGDTLNNRSQLISLPLKIKKNIIVGPNWKYTLPDTGKLYSIGGGLFAAVVEEITLDEDFGDCCKVCHFTCNVYLFNIDGFIKVIDFPVSNKISPFFIKLHEDPCSA